VNSHLILRHTLRQLMLAFRMDEETSLRSLNVFQRFGFALPLVLAR